MITIGRISRETKGPPVPGYSETPDCLTAGSYYRCPKGHADIMRPTVLGLGTLSRETKGTIIPGYAETPDCLVAGAFLPRLTCPIQNY